MYLPSVTPRQVECITTCGEDREAKYPPIKAGHYLLEKLGLMWMVKER